MWYRGSRVQVPSVAPLFNGFCKWTDPTNEHALGPCPISTLTKRSSSSTDEECGLKAIIAIHSTHLGPAAGGARFWHYDEDDLALIDALRLSRGMSYKNAMAGLPLGGGKSVILANKDMSKTHRAAPRLRQGGQ